MPERLLATAKIESREFPNATDERLLQRLNGLIEDAARAMKTCGLEPAAPTSEMLGGFRALPTQRKIAILNDLEISCKLFGELENDGRFLELGQEIEIVQKFIKKAGLQLPKAGFFELLAEGDFIEIYNAECVQIYRSWNFFRYCSYSLPDLLVFPFDVLYSRPSWVLKRLVELVPQALSPSAPLIDFQACGIKEYLLTEQLPGHNRANLVTMKYCTGLFGATSNRPEAFICSATSRPLSNQVHRGRRPIDFI